MKEVDVIICALIMLLATSLGAVIRERRHDQDQWSAPKRVLIYTVLSALLYGALALGYQYVLRPSDRWAKLFYPEVVQLRGQWLERKTDTTSVRPITMLSFDYDPRVPGSISISGISPQRDAETAGGFTAVNSWSNIRTGLLEFAFVGTTPDDDVKGVTVLGFNMTGPGPKSGTGYFYTNQPRRMGVTIEKVSDDFWAPDSVDRYLRRRMPKIPIVRPPGASPCSTFGNEQDQGRQ